MSLLHTIKWHFHGEPHPPAYFFLMFPWARIVGTTEFLLRLPTAAAGAASVAVLFFFGRRTAGTGAALLAAGLLAFSGHHIYWSQQARLYAFATLLALVSSWLLLRLYQGAGTRPCLQQFAYAGFTWLGLATQMLFWPLLAAQWLWAALACRERPRLRRRIHTLQALVVMLGAPHVAHAVYRAYKSFLGAPDFEFVRHFLSFGFLTLPDPVSVPPRPLPVWLGIGITALLVVALLGWLQHERPRIATMAAPQDRRPSSSLRGLYPVAAGCSMIVLGLAVLAYRRQELMALVALLPAAALTVPRLGSWASEAIEHVRVGRWVRQGSDGRALPPELVLATVAPLLVILVSFVVPLLAPRQFLLYVPFLLLVLARGLWSWRVRRSAVVLILAALAATHIGALDHWRGFPKSHRDYKSLAEKMDAHSRGGELVLVRAKDWPTTPLFYYLRPNRYELVPSDYEKATVRNPGRRVWGVEFEGRELSPSMRRALEGYDTVATVEALRSEARLYEP